jgi:hypothetical protein
MFGGGCGGAGAGEQPAARAARVSTQAITILEFIARESGVV